MNVYKNIRGTDLVVFVLILFPQMSNILLLKSVPLAQPQISTEIMCPYYLYVVLYFSYRHQSNLLSFAYLLSHVVSPRYSRNI